MEVLRTPDHCFDQLVDYPFKPNYIDLNGIRMHYVDEGNADNGTVLLLHGEPTWSYLYRKMIPVYVDAGFRVIAPDLIGFGKSDKPDDPNYYTYALHEKWLSDLILNLDLKGINMFCQDWGGLLGLRVITKLGDRFDRVVASNTFLPTGALPTNEAFLKWRKFSLETEVFDIGRLISRATVTEISEQTLAAYDAPFPEEKYKAAARIFPSLVPIDTEDPAHLPNMKAWEVLMQWKKPFLTLFGDADPITKGGDRFMQGMIPGTKGHPHEIIEGGGHFIQEDHGVVLANKMIDFIQTTSV